MDSPNCTRSVLRSGSSTQVREIRHCETPSEDKISFSRQKDHSKFRQKQQLLTWDAILNVLARRTKLSDAGARGNGALLYAVEQFASSYRS